MRLVIPGGTGQIGNFLARELRDQGHEVFVIGRSVEDPALRWDGRSDGPWMEVIDGAHAVVNLAGRSVNCRYHWANLNEMMNSRIDSAAAVGRAIAAAKHPPGVWLQASTATIYTDTRGPAHTEMDGVIGAGTRGRVPDYWNYSVNIARAWELALAAAPTPDTRRVAMRFGFTMSPDAGGIFDWLMWLVRRGLGGPFYGGGQYVTWVTDVDLVRAVLHLVDSELAGPVNVTAPNPLENRPFMKILREAAGVSVGLPIWRGVAELGALFLDTDVELMRKSRRVVPARLLDDGFVFTDGRWQDAAPELVTRWQQMRDGGGASGAQPLTTAPS